MPEDIYWNPGTARVPWAGNTPFDGLSIARKGSSMKNILISGILETRGRPSPNGGYVSEKRRRPGHLRVQAAPQRRVRRPGSKNLDMRRLRRGPGNSGRDRDGRWVLACTEPPGAAPCRSGQLQSLRTVRSFTGQNSADSAPPSAIDNAWKSATFGRSAISCGSGIGRPKCASRPQGICYWQRRWRWRSIRRPQGVRHPQSIRRPQCAGRPSSLGLPQAPAGPRVGRPEEAFCPAQRLEETQVARSRKSSDPERLAARRPCVQTRRFGNALRFHGRR
jgi:hypothetical protein